MHIHIKAHSIGNMRKMVKLRLWREINLIEQQRNDRRNKRDKNDSISNENAWRIIHSYTYEIKIKTIFILLEAIRETDTWLHFKAMSDQIDWRPWMPRPWTCTITNSEWVSELLNWINIWIALCCIYLSVHLHWCTYEADQMSRLSWWSRRSLCRNQVLHSSYTKDDDDPHCKNGKIILLKRESEMKRKRIAPETTQRKMKRLNLKWTMLKRLFVAFEFILRT